MTYWNEGVGYGVAETGQEVGDGEHHEDPAAQQTHHLGKSGLASPGVLLKPFTLSRLITFLEYNLSTL